jgi:hypothetical protein
MAKPKLISIKRSLGEILPERFNEIRIMDECKALKVGKIAVRPLLNP